LAYRSWFLLFTAWGFNATSLLVIFTIFWVFEAWLPPAYVQLVQAIYPIEQCGHIPAAIGVGFVALLFTFTPLAGWLLDHWGYRA